MAEFKDLDRLLKSFAGNTVPGCSCAVAKNGKILYEGYHGYADLENKIPITEDTVYRLYSMTKVIVCTAAMILFERGAFTLNEPFSDYFPEYKDSQVVHMKPNGTWDIRKAENPILVRNTFNMSCGLPTPTSDHPTDVMMRQIREKMIAEKGKYTLLDDVRAMGSVPLRFEPGTRWLYGYGHDMVAALIEVTSGMSVGEFLKKEIFEPLGMETAAYRYFGNMRERMIKLYEPQGDGTFKAIPGPRDEEHEPDAIHEAGNYGLFSNLRDYLTFTQMLANGGVHEGKKIISRHTIDLMRRNMLSEEQLKDFRKPYLEGYGYGLGVRTMIDPQGISNSPIGEFGWTGMAGTWAAIVPEENLSVVYMHQTMPNLQEYHHHRVRSVVFGCME